jgi:hypothetical protein
MDIGHIRYGNLRICQKCGVGEVFSGEEAKGIAKFISQISKIDDNKLIYEFFFDAGMIDRGMQKETKRIEVSSKDFEILFDEYSKEAIMESLRKLIKKLDKIPYNKIKGLNFDFDL